MKQIKEKVFSKHDGFLKSIFHSNYIFLALIDISEGLKERRIWFLLAWQDVKLRYRRSTLGPFWITLSMAITIYSMGLLYGRLFKMDLSQYYPFLASGILTWSLISSLLTEGVTIFVEAEQFIKQMKQPYSVFVFRIITRCFIIFFHNILVFLPIIFIFHVKISIASMFIPFSLVIIWINGASLGVILALLGTRFRDLAQLIISVVQIIFFLTPIIWSPSALPERYHYIIKINPFAQFLELLRNPLLGISPSQYTILFTCLVTLLGLCISFSIFARYRARIPYWL